MLAAKLFGLVMLYAFVAWSLVRSAPEASLAIPRRPSRRTLPWAPRPVPARIARVEERPSLAPYRPAA